MMQALGTTITYLWHQAFSEAIERLNSLSTDDYYIAIAQYGHAIKRTIIYVNYIISLIIIVPYLLLVGCDFVIYIFRVLGDVLHSNVESAKVQLRQKTGQKIKVQQKRVSISNETVPDLQCWSVLFREDRIPLVGRIFQNTLRYYTTLFAILYEGPVLGTYKLERAQGRRPPPPGFLHCFITGIFLIHLFSAHAY